MRSALRTLRRQVYIVVALAFLAAGIAPLLPMLTESAGATGLVTSRSIEMSDSLLSATSTTYAVSFSIATSATVQAIILDFCDNDPLVADTTCTLPGGFTLTAAPAISGQSGAGSCNLSTFTTAATLNSNRTLELSAASGVAMTAAGACTFNITTVTNPNSANHSFYARIYTFDTTAHASSYSPGILTNVIDDGGFALSTAAQITVSATVQETLTFCVSGAAPGAGCSGLSAPAVTIGHGSPLVITAAAVDESPAYTQVTTNANSGVIVRMKATNTCANGGISSTGGTVCNIPGIGGSATALVAGTADFGMCVAPAGTAVVATNYKDTAHSCPTTWVSGVLMGMNGANLTGTFGDQIYSYVGPVTNDNCTLEFGATAAAATQAGIYTGNELLIATGTF